MKKSNSKSFGIVFIMMLFSLTLFSQNSADNWAFKYFGIKFNDDSVSVLSDFSVPNNRGMGIMSDSNGDLLFYSDGVTVWNRNNEQMPNGDSICMNGSYSVQQSLIVPKPNSDFLYYVFSLEPFSYYGPTGLSYSVVNMNLDNGLGDVILKGEEILDSLSNRLTATYHKNYKDVWLIAHKYETNQYYSIIITENGISETPVLSTGGEIIDGWIGGQLKASPDGTKVVSGYNKFTFGKGFDLFEFNPATGELMNPLVFTTPSRGINGAEFSSDGTKLYLNQSGSTGEATLFQYDVSEYDYIRINNSRLVLFYPQQNILGEMQIAPNGKIYIAKMGGQFSGTQYLGVINAPNKYGEESNAVEMGQYLEGASCFTSFMPNFIQNYFFKTDFEVSNTCFGDSAFFRITNTDRLDSVNWVFGDGVNSNILNPKHRYSVPGNYTVSLFCYYPEKVDTIIEFVEIHPLPVIDIGNDTTVCHGFIIDLSSYEYNFNWFDSSANNYYMPDTSGVYWVEAQNEFGCTYIDSIDILIKPVPYFRLGNDTSICDNTEYFIAPNIVYENCSYLWNDNSIDTILLVETTGLYWLEIINSHACSYMDSVFIEVINAPNVDLGNDTAIDKTASIILDAGYFGDPTCYLWEDNSTWQQHYLAGSILDTGIYTSYVKVTDQNGCVDSDTINIDFYLSGYDDHNELFPVVEVYPNPCRESLIINNKSNSILTLKMYNNIGGIVLTKKLMLNKQSIDVSIYKKSIYIIEISKNSASIITTKLVVE